MMLCLLKYLKCCTKILVNNMKKNLQKIIEIMRETYKSPKCELEWTTPFELLVAVILSAQCTDKRVNMVVAKLFKEYNKPEQFANISQEELEDWIKPCGFYHNKARNIISASRDIVERYNGEVPSDKDSLMQLSGVGEKTASVVQAVAYNVPAIAVDTHVLRLSNRFGFVNNQKDPHKVMIALQRAVPKEYWIDFHYAMVLHGRYVCKAQKPNCGSCCFKEYCRSCKIK